MVYTFTITEAKEVVFLWDLVIQTDRKKSNRPYIGILEYKRKTWLLIDMNMSTDKISVYKYIQDLSI